MALILASSSPRRKDLLLAAGFQFQVVPSTVDEAIQPGELAADFARRLARDKALEVAGRVSRGAWVLGADTIVVLNGQILGKPADASDAARMLRLLSGAEHEVITGVCLARAPASLAATGHEVTRVTFRPLSEAEIAAYVRSGEPMDKAGAYGVQGLASRFVTRIEGCYFNVVGLPVARVDRMLREQGAIKDLAVSFPGP